MNSLNYNKTDSHLVFFFVLSLLFSGSNVYALAYPILKGAVFLGFVGMFYRFSFSMNQVKSNIVVQLSILLIFVWLFFSILSSMVQPNDEMISLAFRYTAYSFVFLLISFLKKDISYLFYKWYCTILYAIAFLSFLSFILSVFNITTMVELVSSGGRVYLTTFFNIVMSDSKVTLGGFTFYRFQSIFEEPGTFAFLLLPVIYWYKIVVYNKFKFISLILMLLSTLSIGAMFSAIIICIVYYFIKKPLHSLPFFIIFFVSFIFSLVLFPEFNDFLSYKFGIGKYEGQHSSFGARVLEVSYVTETLSSRLFGSGFSASNILLVFGNNVSVGLFRQVIYSGAIGGVAIVTLNVVLGIYSIQQLKNKNK
ncbi:MAG: hypothetical protein RPS47_04400, partial [Colwellia sp.]